MTELLLAGIAGGLAICTVWLASAERRFGTIAERQRAGAMSQARAGLATDAQSSVLAVASIGILVAAMVAIAPQLLISGGDAGSSLPATAGATDRQGDVAALERYLAKVGGGTPPQYSPIPKVDQAGLPDVDTMITRLAARLEQAGDDVEGWKTLGWSYLNTGRAHDAVAAYERAARLAPDRADIADALEDARNSAAPVAAAAEPEGR